MINTTRVMVGMVAAGLAFGGQAVSTQAASKGFGCFLVTASEVNIRERPHSKADVIGTAVKGDILIKRKLLCTLRGYWCAVRAGSIDGYVDKAYMQKITCP